MFHIVLYEPEIAPNTGNIIRLCANTGSSLHLIHPLGFELDDAKLRRAGLDYREWASVKEHENLDRFLSAERTRRLFACSTKGRQRYSDVHYAPGDALVFGPETRGLPPDVLAREEIASILRIPMQPSNRSINLSNAVAVILYEALRQQDFSGCI